MEEEELMTPSEVAVFLKLHLKTVYKMAADGTIPATKIGSHWRFRRSDILNLVSPQAKKQSSLRSSLQRFIGRKDR